VVSISLCLSRSTVPTHSPDGAVTILITVATCILYVSRMPQWTVLSKLVEISITARFQNGTLDNER